MLHVCSSSWGVGCLDPLVHHHDLSITEPELDHELPLIIYNQQSLMWGTVQPLPCRLDVDLEAT